MRRLFLAAGHYPGAPGAGHDGFYEHEEAARWCEIIASYDRDFVQLVPIGTLKEKTAWINARAGLGDVAVELHFNSAADKDGNRIGEGSVTLYHPGSDSGKALAAVVQTELAKIFPPDRGIVEGWYRGDKARGAYYFLRNVRVPALILEPEFVHRREVIQSRRGAACGALFATLRSLVKGKEEKPNVLEEVVS